MKANVGTVLKFFIFLAFGILLIWLSFSSIDDESWDKMLMSFKEIKYGWLILSAFLALVGHVSRAIRWKMLLDTFGKKVRLDNTLYSLMIGYLFNMAFPRLGEAARAGFLNRYEKVPFDKAFGTIITERAIDLLCLLILLVVLLIIEFDTIGNFAINDILLPVAGKIQDLLTQNILFVVILAVVGIAILVLMARFFRTFLNKIQGVLKSLMEGVLSIGKLKNPGGFIFHTVFIWALYFLMVYLVFFAIPGTSHLTPIVGLGVLCFGTFGVIVAPGGLGAYPYIVSNFMALYGVNIGVGVAFGWVTWTVQNLLLLITGLISLLMLPLVNKSNENTADHTEQNTEAVILEK